MNKHQPEATGVDAIFQRYLHHQRSLGRRYTGEEGVLGSCARFIHKDRAADLDADLFDRWCRSISSLKAVTRRAHQRVVRNACLYRQRTEPNCFVPDITRFPRAQPHPAPFIFTSEQVAQLLEMAAQRKPTNNSPLIQAVSRLALVLLFTAGLRRGEVTRLTLADVDASTAVLQIRQSKFHKSRAVPLSPDGARELQEYLRLRLAWPFDTSPSSALLFNTSRGQRGYTGGGLAQLIHSLFVQADIRDVEGRPPRVHDLRHTFAIQALLRWYREGADVQSNLPKLALYMGHVSIVSTAYYLRWIPELQLAASSLFEERFGHLVKGELQ
jgi:integrase/recombinase XerD